MKQTLRRIWHRLLSRAVRDRLFKVRCRLAAYLVHGPSGAPEINLQDMTKEDKPSSPPANLAPGLRTLYLRSDVAAPLLQHRSERSILDEDGQQLIAYEVAGRRRLATCSGVAWFCDRFLAVVNLYGQNLRIYRLNEPSDFGELSLELMHEFSDDITFPEDVAVSGDGRLIAITHSLSDRKGVSLRRADSDTRQPKSEFARLRAERTCHGIQFSPDSRHFAYTTVDGPGSVEVVNVETESVERVCYLANRYPELRPKAVSFTADGKYVAIIYSPVANVSSNGVRLTGRIAIHRYCPESGVIDEACEAALCDGSSLLSGLELAVFVPKISSGGYQLLAANQARDIVVEILFEPERRKLTATGRQISGFSFPHGIDVSKDSRYLAVTSYGDDTLRIFRLIREVSQNARDTRTHILLCGHSSSAPYFGAERSMVDLAEALSENGYRLSCLVPQDSFEYTAELSRYADMVVQLPFNWRKHPRPFSEWNVKDLEQFIRSHDVDIVHLNSTVVPDVALAARRAGVASVLHARELVAEDPEICEYLGCSGEAALRFLEREADFVIANSGACLGQFSQSRNHFLLYNTYDEKLGEIPEPLAEGKLRVGMIGNNTFRKGIADFLRIAVAARIEPELEFVLIGPKTPDLNYFMAQIDQVFPPPQLRVVHDAPSPVQAISMVDVVVSLSDIPESFGRTIVEAMAASRPVVAYSSGAVSELVSDKVSGYLVQTGERKEVVRHLLRLCRNRNEVLRLGTSGKEIAERRFSRPAFVRNLGQIYAAIVTEKATVRSSRIVNFINPGYENSSGVIWPSDLSRESEGIKVHPHSIVR